VIAVIVIAAIHRRRRIVGLQGLIGVLLLGVSLAVAAVPEGCRRSRR
jgi:hypothetical protein